MKKKIIVIVAVILSLGCLLGALFAFGVFDKEETNDKSKDKIIWDAYVTKQPSSTQSTQFIDINGNNIADCLENNDKTTDSDNDGISDYNEIIYTLTNPLLADSDNNGTIDPDEDNDKDGLSNSRELELGTSPTSSDTDCDGLNDSEEINTYYTDPLKADTDDDGATDGWEITNGTNPTEFNERFSVTKNCTNENITTEVNLTANGTAVESITITPVVNHALINNTIPGYIGPAFEYLTNGEIGLASICFQFDSSLLSKPNFQPTIYCLNENTQKWYELDTTVTDNKATIKTTHFSKYILLDKSEYASYTKEEYELDNSLDDGTDSNNDGITDYITKLMCDGKIRTGTGAKIFGDYSYEEIQANDDIDGDGLKNGDEVVVDYVIGIPEDASTFRNNYYKIYDKGYNWLDVQAFCDSMGGHMLTITSPEEQGFIQTLIGSESNRCYWLGATDINLEGQWEWITGEPWDYQNWKSGEPNDGDAGEDYAELMTWNSYTWNDGEKEGDSDEFSKENHGYICEWEYDSIESRTTIFLNSSPTKSDTDNDGFEDALDPTPNDADVFASMEDYKNYFFKDKTTVTIYVKQPIWNNRVSISDDDSKRSKIYHDFGGTGHAYLGIDYADGEKLYFGLYGNAGEASSGSIPLALFGATVTGYILGDLYDSETGNNNSETVGTPLFTVAKTFEINEDQLDTLIDYRNNRLTTGYNLVNYNCTTFAVKALEECNLKVQIYEHDWLLLDNEYIFTEDVQSLTSMHFYGYCPADAAEDIKKNYNEYLISRNYTLNDGSSVTAYEAVYYNVYKLDS